MSGIRSALSTTAIVVGAGAAMLTGGIAKADPAAPAPPVPAPNVPGLNVVEQIVDPAAAPQLLQNAASILTGTPATPAAPAAPPPVATASVNLPQQLTGLPGTAPGAPASTLPGMPVTAPATTATTPAVTQPGAEITLPQVPGLPVPLPQQVSFPGDLVSLIPGTVNALTPTQAAAVATQAPASAAPGTGAALASLFPTAALP
ncbi:hypothetical protein [[Mycobacterium] wendilense]|uniref:Uncharacterized protein n=1 Tax=[Mycobacterium] wendilense TaxID=3064284 RepID=A0ABN9NVQ7_9MYCO|nr:hypothetical protein [Mycolicibacterium sp. MU0050]CAJ1580600.1 hypothetical protein MU0050_001124 [Mycolicibacterium sp. MU0050]